MVHTVAYIRGGGEREVTRQGFNGILFTGFVPRLGKHSASADPSGRGPSSSASSRIGVPPKAPVFQKRISLLLPARQPPPAGKVTRSALITAAVANSLPPWSIRARISVLRDLPVNVSVITSPPRRIAEDSRARELSSLRDVGRNFCATSSSSSSSSSSYTLEEVSSCVNKTYKRYAAERENLESPASPPPPSRRCPPLFSRCLFLSVPPTSRIHKFSSFCEALLPTERVCDTPLTVPCNPPPSPPRALPRCCGGGKGGRRYREGRPWLASGFRLIAVRKPRR